MLLLAATVWPVPAVGGGMAPGGAIVLAYWMDVRPLSGSAAAATWLQSALFLLATFSNTVFLVAPVIRHARRVTLPCAAFFVGAVVVNLAVAVVLPDFASMATYWLWLASIAAMAFAFVVLPGTGRAAVSTVKRRVPGRVDVRAGTVVDGSVPGIVWGGLLVIVCWTLVPYAAPGAPSPGGTNAGLTTQTTLTT